MTEANSDNPTAPELDEALTEADIRVLLTDHLIEVRRLVALLTPPAAAPHDPADFSNVATPPPTGAMHTAGDSEVVARARTSLRAASAEVGFAEGVLMFVDELAALAAVAL